MLIKKVVDRKSFTNRFVDLNGNVFRSVTPKGYQIVTEIHDEPIDQTTIDGTILGTSNEEIKADKKKYYTITYVQEHDISSVDSNVEVDSNDVGEAYYVPTYKNESFYYGHTVIPILNGGLLALRTDRVPGAVYEYKRIFKDNDDLIKMSSKNREELQNFSEKLPVKASNDKIVVSNSSIRTYSL